jgi:hypothetical protein
VQDGKRGASAPLFLSQTGGVRPVFSMAKRPRIVEKTGPTGEVRNFLAARGAGAVKKTGLTPFCFFELCILATQSSTLL